MLYSSHSGARQQPAGSRVCATHRARDPYVRMLDAMIATASYRGYDRTTVERVLQTANVAPAVFDEHFADKEECFLRALDALIARIECRVLERVERAAPWPERVRGGLEALLSALAEDSDGARVVLVESLCACPAASKRHHSLLRLFPPLLEEGRFYCVTPDLLPPYASEAMVGGIASILHRRALEDRAGELPRLRGDLAYFAMLPYLGHHRAIVAAFAREPAPQQRG
jgi:AcrR family transcriptional regulator